MSAVLNDRDAILQAATVRIVNPKNAWINLQSSAPGFHLNAAGQVDLGVVTVTADLVGLDDAVAFSAVGATLSNASGRRVDVTYGGQTAIVTATVVSNGDEFKRSIVIPVLRDGASGTSTPGAPGARGAGHYYAAGSAWSDVVAQAACPGSTPVLNDVVTISSSTYAMEKRWTGSAWVENGVVINGRLIVPDSILTSALGAEVVTARNMGVGAVTARSIAVSGNGDNIIPDPAFRDLVWWNQVGRTVNDYNGTTTPWKSGRALAFASTGGVTVDRITSSFPMTPGATYRVELQVFISTDFVGDFTAAWLIPGDQWHLMGVPASGYAWPDQLKVSFTRLSAKGFQTFSAEFTVPVNGFTSSSQLRVCYASTAGVVEIGGMSITRMADAALVVKGGIKADHIDVDRLAAIIAYLGNVEIGAGGSLRQGQTGYDQGQGFFLGAGLDGNAKLSMAAGSSKILMDPVNNVFKLVNPQTETSLGVSLSFTNQRNRTNTFNYEQFTVFANISGATGDLRYQWSCNVVDGDVLMVSDPGATSCTFKCRGQNITVMVNVSLIVTDASNVVIYKSTRATVGYGTAA